MSPTTRILAFFLTLINCLCPSAPLVIGRSSLQNRSVGSKVRSDTIRWNSRQSMVETQPQNPSRKADSSLSPPRKHGSSSCSCHFCQQKFDSRNAMFRHIRADPDCSAKAGLEQRKPGKEPPSRPVLAFQLAYFRKTSSRTRTRCKEAVNNSVEGQIAGSAVMKALEHAICMMGLKDTRIVGSTQASLARQRHSTLCQEFGASACADVLVTALEVPHLYKDTFNVENVTGEMQNYLDDNQEEDVVVKIRTNTLLPSGLHAERECTQHIYHYLLPVSWLPDGEAFEEWLLKDLKLQENVTNSPHTNRFVTSQPSDSLRRLRDALRTAESPALNNRKIRRRSLQTKASGSRKRDKPTSPGDHDDDDVPVDAKLASGRFGTLSHRQRKPWHNFADPTLQGEASPSQEPVWRVLDKARIVRYKSHTRESDGQEEAIAVVEFRGDGFVKQQVRRIMGTALAMAHGWLPDDTIERATRPTQLTWTPLAPPNRLYLADVRFHFAEQKKVGKRLLPDSQEEWIQRHLLQQLDSIERRSEEGSWLKDLCNSEQKMVLDDADLRSTSSVSSADNDDDRLANHATPPQYKETLDLLREIVKTGAWPRTSQARSNVILPNTKNGDVGDEIKSGSFTIVNPAFRRNVDDEDSGFGLPNANMLFPELVQSVFALEAVLSKSTRRRIGGDGNEQVLDNDERPGSSHCAVNCNAQFTPHVDSGRGAGQSLSMIVGLGDYERGDLMVEGTCHQIRYDPIEFDGWKLRHWTQGYDGERFSLVWFTPDVS